MDGAGEELGLNLCPSSVTLDKLPSLSAPQLLIFKAEVMTLAGVLDHRPVH